MTTLDFDILRAAVGGSHVALRCRTELQPAGGVGDKVFPSTYGVSDGAPTRYATETYREDGVEKRSVLLDSVASSANRHELALQEGLDAGEISFPNPFVDFTVDEELIEIGRITALQAPHRLADAIFVGTSVKIVSGDSEKVITIGTDWMEPKSYTAETNTMTKIGRAHV